MAKKTALQQAIDQIQKEIDERMRALDVLQSVQNTSAKIKRQRKAKAPAVQP